MGKQCGLVFKGQSPAAAPAAPEAPQLTREQQRALRMLERQSAYDRLTTGASVLV